MKAPKVACLAFLALGNLSESANAGNHAFQSFSLALSTESSVSPVAGSVNAQNGSLSINPYKYVQELTKIAESGDAYAQNKLGLIYDSDYEVSEATHVESGLWMIPNNDALAVSWYRRAANQEFAEAQFHLAEKYRFGKGVDKDAKQYLSLYQRSALNGNSSGQMALGFLYENGFGVAKDDAQAAIWYRRSAEQGNAASQLYLAALYSYGRGVPKDRVQSYKWSNLALSKMTDGGLRDALAKRMSAKQIAEAQSLSAAFAAKRESPEIPVRYQFTGNPTGISVRSPAVAVTDGSEQMETIQSAVTRDFKDDKSARFRDVAMTTDDVTGERYVCGFVNGKNSYGAYAGYKPFYGVWKLTGSAFKFVVQAGSVDWCRKRGIVIN